MTFHCGMALAENSFAGAQRLPYSSICLLSKELAVSRGTARCASVSRGGCCVRRICQEFSDHCAQTRRQLEQGERG